MGALPLGAHPPLYKALGHYKRALISVGCFTALINVLMLAPPFTCCRSTTAS